MRPVYDPARPEHHGAGAVGGLEGAADRGDQLLARAALIAVAHPDDGEQHQHVSPGGGRVEARVAWIGRDVLELRPEQRRRDAAEPEDPLGLWLVLERQGKPGRTRVMRTDQDNRLSGQPCHPLLEECPEARPTPAPSLQATVSRPEDSVKVATLPRVG